MGDIPCRRAVPNIGTTPTGTAAIPRLISSCDPLLPTRRFGHGLLPKRERQGSIGAPREQPFCGKSRRRKVRGQRLDTGRNGKRQEARTWSRRQPPATFAGKTVLILQFKPAGTLQPGEHPGRATVGSTSRHLLQHPPRTGLEYTEERFIRPVSSATAAVQQTNKTLTCTMSIFRLASLAQNMAKPSPENTACTEP